jgi:hypothetical protein
LAGSRYSDVVDIPVDAVIESLHKMVLKARRVVRSGARTAEDVLNSFTREHYGQFVVVKRSAGGLMAELGNGEAIDQTITRSKVLGRVEHEIDKIGYVDYFIEEQVLRTHCVSMSFGYEDFKRQIAATEGYVVSAMRKDMMARTRGPQMRTQALCISRKIEREDKSQDVSVAVA